MMYFRAGMHKTHSTTKLAFMGELFTVKFFVVFDVDGFIMKVPAVSAAYSFVVSRIESTRLHFAMTSF